MRGRIAVLVVCLVFATQSYAALTGVVVNPEGQAVAGARVSAHALELTSAQRARLLSATPEAVLLASVTTDARGRFSVENVKEPVVMLIVTAPGHAPAAARAERNDDLGTIVLTTAATRQGRVTAAGKPLAGATVIWHSDAEVIAKTDESGRYSVPDPSKWAERVIIAHPDFPLLVEPARRLPRATDVATDRTLAPGVAISGKVVAEDGKTAAGGAASRVDGWPVTQSTEDGTFTIAKAPAKWAAITAQTASLHATKVRAAGDVTLRLARPATFSGLVRDSKGQSPVAGVEIQLRPAGRFETFNPTVAISDARGAFTASGVGPGDYEIVAIQPSYSFQPSSISAAAGERVSRTLIMTQLARVTGSVNDEEKKALGGVRVVTNPVSRESGIPMRMSVPRQTTTAPDGTFVLRVEPDSDIQLSARKKGFPDARSSTLRLAPGERKSGVLLTIPAGVTVTGLIVDGDGKPISDVAVTALPTSGAPAGMVMQRLVMTNTRERADDNVRSASDGTFTMRVKEGSYDFGFRRDGFAAKAIRAQSVSASMKPLEVTLEPGVEITGRVTRGGVGIEGVNINVFGESSGASLTQSEADGSFRFTDLNPGTMILSARKEDEFIQINRTITAPANDVALEVPPGGRVSGRVVDKSTKQPVTTFRAGISPAPSGGMVRMMGPPQFRSFTSDDGTFTLENVPPGTVQLNIQAAGYTAGRMPGLTVEEGKTLADIEVTMDRGAKVTGRVTGPDGSAMAGVAVRVDAGDSRMPLPPMMGGASVVTDGNGEYTMEAVENGEKTIVFSRSGYLPAQKTVTLDRSEHRVDAQLSSGVRISGQVVTEGGSPVSEASVTARSASQGDFASRSTLTDAGGNFTMEGLAPGRYSFMASKSGVGSTQLQDVDVSTGVPVRIVVKSGGTIYGRVIGLPSEELAQATVSASSSSGFASGAVDASGNYRIDGAPAGTVRLNARTMGMVGGKSSPVVSVQVEPGSTVQQDIEFKSSTVVSGRVTRDGRPVADAMLGFFPRQGQAQTTARTTTGRDGYYEVSGLDDASYTVSVNDLQRNVPYTAAYEVRGSGTFNIDMKAGVVRGRVTDSSTGEVITEASIQLRQPDGAMTPMMRAGMTDASGAFVIEGVTAGKYYVSAEKDGYGTKIVDLTMGDSAPDLDIKLVRNPGVTMRVVDARDGRLISARVRVTDPQNRVIFESTFRFGSGGGPEPLKLTLEAGSYRATVTAQGYAPQTVQIVSPSSPTVGLTPGGSITVRSRGSSMRRARLMAADGREYMRGFAGGVFTVDPNPGLTTLDNIAPGLYTIQILGAGDKVETTAQVSVAEGQRADVEI